MIAKTTELQAGSKDGKFLQGSSDRYQTPRDYGIRDRHMEVDDTNDVDRMDIEESGVLARQADLMNDALQYGQELQSEFKDDPRREVKQALKDTFALIAYPDARESSLAPLLEVDGRISVAEELNSAILGECCRHYSAWLFADQPPQSHSANPPALRLNDYISRRKFWWMNSVKTAT